LWIITMASMIYNSAVDGMARGIIDFDTNTFKVALVTSSYTPNKDTHTYADDFSAYEVTGDGYTATGATTTCTVTKDTANDKVTVSFSAVNWPTSTITAAGAVIYVRRGGSYEVDDLVAYIDFGGDVTSSGGTFSIGASTITLQN
jgi:hypothetical protein